MNVVVRIFFPFFFQAHLAGLIPAVDWSNYPDRLNICISAYAGNSGGMLLTNHLRMKTSSVRSTRAFVRHRATRPAPTTVKKKRFFACWTRRRMLKWNSPAVSPCCRRHPSADITFPILKQNTSLLDRYWKTRLQIMRHVKESIQTGSGCYYHPMLLPESKNRTQGWLK